MLAALPPEALEGTAPVGPWDVMAPRAFTAMVKKAVAGVRTDTDEAIAAEVRERTGTWLEIDQANPALATWTITGPTEQLVAAEEAAAATVRGMTREELGGRDARDREGRPDHRLAAERWRGHRSRWCGARSGWCMHLDTLAGDGEKQDAAGEVRGTGYPVPVTAAVARVLAADALARGAGTCVLLADDTGHLQRVLRIGAAPENGWTRATLVEAAARGSAEAADSPPPDRRLRAHRRDRRHRQRPRPGLHLPRLRRPGRPVRPGPRRPAPPRTRPPCTTSAPDPAGATGSRPPPCGAAARADRLRRRHRARVDLTPRPPPGRRGRHPARVLTGRSRPTAATPGRSAAGRTRRGRCGRRRRP